MSEIRFWDTLDKRFYGAIGPLLFRRDMQRDMPYLRLDADSLWALCFQGRRVLGFASLSGSGKTLTLHNVWVAPEARKKGHCVEIVESCVGRAREMGAEIVRVTSSAEAVPCYERLGFEVTGERGAYRTMEWRAL